MMSDRIATCYVCKETLSESSPFTDRHGKCHEQALQNCNDQLCGVCRRPMQSKHEPFCKDCGFEDDFRVLYQPRCRTLGDALQWYLEKRPIKSRTRGYVMEDGSFLAIKDSCHSDMSECIMESLDILDKDPMKWFLLESKAVRVTYFESTREGKSYTGIEYYDVTSLQMGSIHDVLAELTSRDKVNVDGHGHWSENGLRRTISNVFACQV